MTKLLIIFIGLTCMLASCGTKDDQAHALKEIISADKAMSALATQEGFSKALLEYSDSNVVKLNEGSLPIIGKQAFADSIGGKTGTKLISWIPVEAKVAESGELGYTWGNWKFITPDTILYGNYFTVWKKQRDGSWKFALDGGNSSPKP
jgi:ketosteroid isomerase-like protein